MSIYVMENKCWNEEYNIAVLIGKFSEVGHFTIFNASTEPGNNVHCQNHNSTECEIYIKNKTEECFS